MASLISLITRTGALVTKITSHRFSEDNGFPLVSGAVFDNLDMAGVIIKEIDFELCSFDDSNLVHASLTSVRFFGDIMMGADFSESILLNVEFYGITGLNNSFRNACLNNV